MGVFCAEAEARFARAVGGAEHEAGEAADGYAEGQAEGEGEREAVGGGWENAWWGESGW